MTKTKGSSGKTVINPEETTSVTQEVQDVASTSRELSTEEVEQVFPPRQHFGRAPVSNPFLDEWQDKPDGAYAHPLPITEDGLKKTIARMRAAAIKLGRGLDGPVVTNDEIVYKLRPRRPRKYTMAQVRAWAAQEGIEVPSTGRLPAGHEAILRYKAAHDL